MRQESYFRIWAEKLGYDNTNTAVPHRIFFHEMYVVQRQAGVFIYKNLSRVEKIDIAGLLIRCFKLSTYSRLAYLGIE